ncbi:MAG: hypothetical protein UR26_C0002G0122 [candidate division TM6 bacterium GW2011_GWF2_32_72]|nr:MAG: hypothetical protein UR26_C0002G0122 [candidate division TM6 bacterium GW2011_GWF2_32_72]
MKKKYVLFFFGLLSCFLYVDATSITCLMLKLGVPIYKEAPKSVQELAQNYLTKLKIPNAQEIKVYYQPSKEGDPDTMNGGMQPDCRRVIFLNDCVIKLLIQSEETDEKQIARFILGHECGHIKETFHDKSKASLLFKKSLIAFGGFSSVTLLSVFALYKDPSKSNVYKPKLIKSACAVSFLGALVSLFGLVGSRSSMYREFLADYFACKELGLARGGVLFMKYLIKRDNENILIDLLDCGSHPPVNLRLKYLQYLEKN